MVSSNFCAMFLTLQIGRNIAEDARALQAYSKTVRLQLMAGVELPVCLILIPCDQQKVQTLVKSGTDQFYFSQTAAQFCLQWFPKAHYLTEHFYQRHPCGNHLQCN